MRCINNKGCEKWLTLNKEYDVQEYNHISFWLIDDTGTGEEYARLRFVKVRKLREILREFNLNNGWETSEDSLEETLRECYETVWEGNDVEHRWRIDYDVVVKISDEGCDRFFKFSACKGTNQNTWEDAGYVFEGIDNVKEVFPKEVKTIIYE